jgi:hypothetical protein
VANGELDIIDNEQARNGNAKQPQSVVTKQYPTAVQQVGVLQNDISATMSNNPEAAPAPRRFVRCCAATFLELLL